ncbi:hypothetical protein conserved [Leishmania donovani]|uniref:Uncharacterized protein n=3 Tax=Leishmania donovani species complex TaxID=38574 RepID=A4HUY5_LEIIN|nr:conserved hypothetical protein [Leishmania infantum JPCM5]XP_003859052.1 hypothetical protein, conserved [Leishmania donovani]CAC9460845.1 hypothetical_protein_-_conserved [Leishmania infantum]AYU76844.1 hypothetical protein LdCL_110013000 [Leishmania donovani]TPP39857.1 hypothetical protein CGC20_30930 [Leishmania donovani]TPP53023.1 hypothetical protein CGC21_0875 [Leishmania donovani]CAJ1986903.1 hypothetical protein conserved [Leishmania donovani]|eukprot:XP_001463876.1 conserved hypothetical protein [Leishmania infantum JPCM5]
MAAADQLRYAAQMIELARSEEREDGNPLTAVRCYTTAMEVIASEASKRAATIESNEARRFFLFQVRSKLEMYHERAELLLQVANGSGLLDKPSFGNGDVSAFQTNYPPALFASAVANENSNTGNGGVGSCSTGGGFSVLGIPLQPQRMAPSALPTQTQSSYDDSKEPPMSCYLKPDDDATAEPPPVTPELDLDELMKNLGAPPES